MGARGETRQGLEEGLDESRSVIDCGAFARDAEKVRRALLGELGPAWGTFAVEPRIVFSGSGTGMMLRIRLAGLGKNRPEDVARGLVRVLLSEFGLRCEVQRKANSVEARVFFKGGRSGDWEP